MCVSVANPPFLHSVATPCFLDLHEIDEESGVPDPFVALTRTDQDVESEYQRSCELTVGNEEDRLVAARRRDATFFYSKARRNAMSDA